MPPIVHRPDPPPLDEYWTLFLTTGWNDEYRLAPVELGGALAASWAVETAWEGERLVGIGRAVADGTVHAMIYDLIVAPDRRGRGIGGEILDRLVARCRAAGIRDVQLFCARGQRAFYERRGFRARPEDAPGMEHEPDQAAAGAD